MTRPSRRTRYKPLTDSEYSEGVVDGDAIDWPSGTETDVESLDSWKQPVVAATTADIDPAATGVGDTVDGVTLALNDRWLVKDNTSAFENGIYVASSTSSARAGDMDDDGEVLGTVVFVIGGTANAGTAWKVTNTATTVIGVDDIVWDEFGTGGGGVTFGTPALTLGTSNANGSTDEAIRRDATILAFDATAPTTAASGDAAATGAAAVAARRDHKHGMPTIAALSASTPVQDGGAGAAGSGTAASKDDHKHPGDKVAIVYVIDGAGSTITTGVKGDLSIPFACTITGARLLADQSGAIVVNVWKDTYANFPPVVGDKITASAPPTIAASGVKSDDTTLTGWTTSVSAGDTLRFNVDSVTSIQRVTLTLTATRT